MSYDIYFLKCQPGQSWDAAMEALENRGNGSEAPTRPENWDQVASGVREILGEVSIFENPPAWQIIHEQTAIELSCLSGEWSMSVPYWSEGDAAKKITGYLHAIAAVVHAATGLEAYDPQAGEPLASDEWTEEQAASVFDVVAETFGRRG